MAACHVIHAKTLVSLAAEKAARGNELFRPVQKMDNALIIIKRGIIEDIVTAGTSILAGGAEDLGDVLVLPPLVNAHTHSQLSWLAGKTLWGHGFSDWLKSMIPRILELLNDPLRETTIGAALAAAWAQMAACGTGLVGDIGGSIPGALSMTASCAKTHGIEAVYFCEWFGFPAIPASPWPERCQAEIHGDIQSLAAPCGHALYSTSPAILRKARRWCRQHNRIFTFHLAESDGETEMLLHGKGGIYEAYRDKVLPPDWRPPCLRPLAAAKEYGLLGRGVLAVHGVKLNAEETAILGASGAALCLCPRSNRNLAVGDAPVKELLESGTLLCLGTDGLSSNTDLDVRKDAAYLRDKHGLDWPALWRMLTVNGAEALGYPPGAATLIRGNRAAFSIWREDELQ